MHAYIHTYVHTYIHTYVHTYIYIEPGGPVVIILASGSEVRGFDPGRGKNPEYDFLRKVSKVAGPVP